MNYTETIDHIEIDETEVNPTIKNYQPPIDNPANILAKMQTYTNGFYTNGNPASEDGSEDGKVISEAVYWAEYHEHPDVKYEWSNGILQEVPMAKIIQSHQYQWFFILIEQYLRNYPIAMIINLELSFRFPTATGSATRKPDMGIILHTNPNQAHMDDRTYQGICDICIESLSDSKPSEITRDTVTKYGEYEYAGVREYFILDDQEDRHMAFYELDPATGQYREMVAVDGIIRSSVLPGFQFRIEDLYELPPLRELVNDPVYQGYVLIEFQREAANARQARRMVRIERQRAEQAQRLAEQRAQLFAEERQRAEQQAQLVEEERQRAEQQAQLFAEERQRAEQQAQLAQEERQRARQQAQLAQEERQRAAKYAELLRNMGVDPESI
ncbi:MAG: Uma2 family endonuclease [Chloroflexota bacterium]